MADRLYLSAWLRQRGDLALDAAFKKLIELFPHSKLGRNDATFRIHAVSYAEPALLEIPLKMPPDPRRISEAMRDFAGADICYELETAWDLWAHDGEWAMAPARVLLSGYRTGFERDSDADLRIDFGQESQFLPEPGAAEGLAMVRANIQSLLHLAHDVDERLPVEKRQLWSESGVPFTEKLEAALR